MATIQELAQQYRDRFTLYKRSEDDVIWTRKDNQDDEALELIAATHDNREMFPDDYRYEYTVDALDLIIDADEDATRDDLEELAFEIEADVYYHELNEWLSSRADRYGYVDEAVENFGHGDSITDDIAAGQRWEKEEVFRAVLAFLEERADEDEASPLLGWTVVYEVPTGEKVIKSMNPTDFAQACAIKKDVAARNPQFTNVKVAPVFESYE